MTLIEWCERAQPRDLVYGPAAKSEPLVHKDEYSCVVFAVALQFIHPSCRVSMGKSQRNYKRLSCGLKVTELIVSLSRLAITSSLVLRLSVDMTLMNWLA